MVKYGQRAICYKNLYRIEIGDIVHEEPIADKIKDGSVGMQGPFRRSIIV